MINCVVTSKTGTLIIPLPASIYDLYEKLYSVGIKRSPAKVYLDDSEEAKIHVQLQGDTLVDGHLLHLLDDRNTLQDANLLIYRVENASADRLFFIMPPSVIKNKMIIKKAPFSPPPQLPKGIRVRDAEKSDRTQDDESRLLQSASCIATLIFTVMLSYISGKFNRFRT